MEKVLAVLLLVLGSLYLVFALSNETSTIYEKAIKFTAFSYLYPAGDSSPMKANVWRHGCVPSYNLTMIVHGWTENITRSLWIRRLIINFLALRGNCVFFMDYSNFSSGGYFDLLPHFDGISAVLQKKLVKLGNVNKMLMFGFSFGARLVIDAGIALAEQGNTIDKIYACDPAGPGFEFYINDPKKAANFVQCINTSQDKGTYVYNCQQNWRLGVCGQYQVGATQPPMMSHGLCPYFFIESFYNKFVPSNPYHCDSERIGKNLPDDLRMGPVETRTSFSGDIFAATSKEAPWNFIPGISVIPKEVVDVVFEGFEAQNVTECDLERTLPPEVLPEVSFQ